ncbi:MAG: nickel insertion protein, partial [Planctomycetota bacterium]
MRIGFLDCFAGVAGDMWVGALLDQFQKQGSGPGSMQGLGLRDLQAAVASLDLPGVRVDAEKVRRQGIAGTRVLVHGTHGDQRHRHLPEILDILGRADVPESVRAQAQAVFEVLGEAEAKVHDL